MVSRSDARSAVPMSLHELGPHGDDAWPGHGAAGNLKAIHTRIAVEPSGAGTIAGGSVSKSARDKNAAEEETSAAFVSVSVGRVID
jgi:hypothetical protein